MDQSISPGQRVAFFGGSFDPPHLGHLAVAHAALAGLPLDQVLFAPVGAQPLKPAGSTAGFDDRVEMTRLAIEDEPAFKLSLADAPKTGGKPNYTLETLLEVKSGLPQGCSLYCLMGADSFAGLQQWYRAAEIPFAAPLIVASRPGQPLHDLEMMLPPGLQLEPQNAPSQADLDKPAIKLCSYTLLNSAGARTPFYLLPNLDVPISASEVRNRIRHAVNADADTDAESFSHELPILPAAVARYIRQKGLYR